VGTLTHYKGDLFTTTRSVIAHGVNCRGAFAAGVAGQIAKRFPEVKRAYLCKYHSDGWLPGDCQFVTTWNGKIIVNMATQVSYGCPADGVYVKYDAVKQCFDYTLDYCLGNGQGLAIPRIGSGLAGGDWGRIEAIIRDLLMERDVDVSVYTLE